MPFSASSSHLCSSSVSPLSISRAHHHCSLCFHGPPCSPTSLCLPLIRTLVSTLRGNPGDSPPLQILPLITCAGPVCHVRNPRRFCGYHGAMPPLTTTFLREDRRVKAACSTGEQHLENRGKETSFSCGAGLIPRPHGPEPPPSHC